MLSQATLRRYAADALPGWYNRIHELGDTIAVITRDFHVPMPTGMDDTDHLDYIVDWPNDQWYGGRGWGACVHQASGGQHIGGLRPPDPSGWRSRQEIAAAAVQLLRREGQLRPGEGYAVAVLCDCPQAEATPSGCRLCRDQVVYFPAV